MFLLLSQKTFEKKNLKIAYLVSKFIKNLIKALKKLN